VGFRSDNILQSTQALHTQEIPRLIRGKGPHAWDAGAALGYAARFLTHLRTTLEQSKENSAAVWRLTMLPGQGIDIKLLRVEEVDIVKNGEDRIGFLPRTFYEGRVAQQRP
jgi:RAT1-interacting protein